MFVPFCRLQDVRPFVFKRGWDWERFACVTVLCSDERTLRPHLVLAVHSSCDHVAPRSIRTRKSCAGEVPARPKLILLSEATVRDEYCHWLPSVHLQDGLGTSQDFVHEGQHDVHPDYCGIARHVVSYEDNSNDDNNNNDNNNDNDTGNIMIIITWWWGLYSCRNSLLRQKSPCFDRKSPSGNSYNWRYPLYKIFKAK